MRRGALTGCHGTCSASTTLCNMSKSMVTFRHMAFPSGRHAKTADIPFQNGLVIFTYQDVYLNFFHTFS